MSQKCTYLSCYYIDGAHICCENVAQESELQVCYQPGNQGDAEGLQKTFRVLPIYKVLGPSSNPQTNPKTQ